MRWRERTQRWLETATATEKSANTIVKYRPGYDFFLNTWDKEGWGGGGRGENQTRLQGPRSSFSSAGAARFKCVGKWEGGEGVVREFLSVMASSSLYAAVSFDACDENFNGLSEMFLVIPMKSPTVYSAKSAEQIALKSTPKRGGAKAPLAPPPPWALD